MYAPVHVFQVIEEAQRAIVTVHGYGPEWRDFVTIKERLWKEKPELMKEIVRGA